MAIPALIGFLVGLTIGLVLCRSRLRVVGAKLDICEGYIANLVHEQIFGVRGMSGEHVGLSRALAELLQEKDILSEQEIINRVDQMRLRIKKAN